VPKPPTHVPSGATNIPSDTGGQLFEKWVEFFGDSARTYASLFDDATSRLTSGGYSVADCVADGSKAWSQLAKDWATAWSYGLDTLDEVGQQGLDAGLTPPGTPREQGRGAMRAMAVGAGTAGATAAVPRAAGVPAARSAATSTTGPASTESEATIVPLAGLGPRDHVTITALESIEAGGATISPNSLDVSVVAVEGGTYGARIVSRDRTVAAGLYLGQLEGPDGRVLSPVQLYVSRASGA
jgi:hypothetical protein